MATLLEIRELAITVYSRYELYIDRGFRFVAVLSWLLVVNGQVGYRETLTQALPTLMIALICTLLPMGGVVVVLSLLVILHLYALSIEAALVGGMLLLLLLLVYFRFSPEGGMLLLLYPVCSAMGIPYVLPIIGGLVMTPVSGLAVAVGVILDRFLRFVSSNETAIASTEINTDEMISRFQFLIDGILKDDVMLIYVIAFCAAAVAVYCVRRLSIPYAWIIASGVGSVLELIVLLTGAAMANVQIGVGVAFLGVLVSFGIGVVISFFAFNLNYSRTEHTQFEDDEYYYYVKAVPKNSYARPKRTVKTISTHRKPQERDDPGYDAPSSYRGQKEEPSWKAEHRQNAADELYTEEFSEDYVEDYSGEDYAGSFGAGEYAENRRVENDAQDVVGDDYADGFGGADYGSVNADFEEEFRPQADTYRPQDYDPEGYDGQQQTGVEDY